MNFDRKLTKPGNTFVLLPVYQPLLYSLFQTIEIIFGNSEWKTMKYSRGVPTISFRISDPSRIYFISLKREIIETGPSGWDWDEIGQE